MPRPSKMALALLQLCMVAIPNGQMQATTEVIVRSPYRIVLAADSLASYRGYGSRTECKLFEVGDVYATVSGFAHYGRNYRVTDAIRQGFAGYDTFAGHIRRTALVLEDDVDRAVSTLQLNNPREYGYVMQRSHNASDFVQLAVAQTVREQPMLGIIELRRDSSGRGFTARTTVCPGACRQATSIFYLGYWERIRPYVASDPRSIGSAASIDRLIRMEIAAHPGQVNSPVNILELNRSGARWLQNGGNCSLPGVSW